MKHHNRRRREGRRIELESLETRSLLSTAGLNATTATNDVYYLYETVLERSPSQTDLTYWTGLLEQGVKPQVVYNAFVTSTERQDLVSAGGAPAVPSSSSWQNNAAALNTLPLVSGTSLGGTANVTTFVDNLYTTLLNRSADSSGESYWLSKINNGASLNSVVQGFLYSTEYLQLVSSGSGGFVLDSSTPGDTTAATTFVDSLYTGILGRDADTSGESFWVGRIQAGVNPDTVITAFFTSSEYISGIKSGSTTG